jgi:hypothetical protein
VSPGVDVGLLAKNEVDKEVQDQIVGDWSTWTSKWPLSQVICPWNMEFPKGKGELGYWQTKVVAVLVLAEMECYSSKVFSDLGQIHPRTNQECLDLAPNPILVKKDPVAPTPEMIPPDNTRLIPMLNFVSWGGIFHIRGLCAQMQQ